MLSLSLQRNLFYKIITNCSSDYQSLGFLGLLWEYWDSMGIRTSVGTRVALLGPFWLVLWSRCVNMRLWNLGGQGFGKDFPHYDKTIHWNWERYSFLIPTSSIWTHTLVCLH